MEQNNNSTERLSSVTSATFSGPIPPPQVLERYDQICPGAASRILAMAEKQAEHRRAMEKKVVDSNCSSQKWGLVFGFIIAMTVVIGGIWLISKSKDVMGISSIVAALVSLAGVFIYGKKSQAKEIAAKTAALNSAIPR
jgi:uncharacterized membrane protein